MTPEQEEWSRAARTGRRATRPLLFGLLAGVAVTVGGFGVLALFAEARQERADNGEIVYEHQGSRTTVGALFLPVLLGGVAFLAVFKATGGKLSPEYERSLRR